MLAPKGTRTRMCIIPAMVGVGSIRLGFSDGVQSRVGACTGAPILDGTRTPGMRARAIMAARSIAGIAVEATAGAITEGTEADTTEAVCEADTTEAVCEAAGEGIAKRVGCAKALVVMSESRRAVGCGRASVASSRGGGALTTVGPQLLTGPVNS